MFVWHSQAFAPMNAHLRRSADLFSNRHLSVKEPALRMGIKNKPSTPMEDDGHDVESAAAAAVSQLMLSVVRNGRGVVDCLEGVVDPTNVQQQLYT